MFYILDLLTYNDKESIDFYNTKLFKEWYEWQVLKKYLYEKNFNINKKKIDKMIKYYKLPHEGSYYETLKKVKCQPNGNIPKFFKDSEVTNQLLYLLKNLSHTNNRAKQYNLLYDYFNRLNDETALKWSVNILIDKDNVKKLFGED